MFEKNFWIFKKKILSQMEGPFFEWIFCLEKAFQMYQVHMSG